MSLRNSIQHLDTLYLFKNEFLGVITSELGNFKNLKCLDVSENVLIGEIPRSFAKLKKSTLLKSFLESNSRFYSGLPC